MSEKEEKKKNIDSLKEKMKHPILKEFADYLYANKLYKIEELECLLLKKWDAIFPTPMVFDDAVVGLGDFLYQMGDFVVQKTIGSRFPKVGGIELCISIIPAASYGHSFVYTLESETRSFMAAGCGCKTYNHDPDIIAEDLLDLERRVREGWELVRRRAFALSLLGTPTDLPLGKQKGGE